MLLYLHGFASAPSSKKAQILKHRFAGRGVEMTLPDLTPGDDGFERSSPSSMLAIAEGLLDASAPPHAVMGSSLGGYLASVAASRDPTIAKLVLLAPAFRLFERWNGRLTADERERWRREGLEVDHHATGRKRRLGWQFHEDARGWPAFPEVRVPALVFAGRRDETIPLEDIRAFCERTPTARLVELDDGHELVDSIDRIWEEAWAFLEG
ncbi:MAG TPA: YqiA/YcfP family alpha/beta fold hydrolase [Anaeromyxobacteraceae bacterium]|nr:YqiA/YcfP family alpha/beta fold hydrolase [Anaeromyxobacteraceae bacterium]